MPNQKLFAIITVLTCLGVGSTAYASYTLAQLKEIELLIAAKDCGGLRAYVAASPELLVGTDPLAKELRFFLSAVDNGLIECLSIPVITGVDPFGGGETY